jgi:hypothetical protein
MPRRASVACRTRNPALRLGGLQDAESRVAQPQIDEVGDVVVVLDEDDRAAVSLGDTFGWHLTSMARGATRALLDKALSG